MPEPTDHRAEAEDWTQDAKIHFIQAALRNDDGDLIGFDPKLMRGAKVAALIGIGHALLARGEGQPPQPDNRTDDEKAHDVGPLRFHYASGDHPEPAHDGEDDPFARTMPR